MAMARSFSPCSELYNQNIFSCVEINLNTQKVDLDSVHTKTSMQHIKKAQ